MTQSPVCHHSSAQTLPYLIAFRSAKPNTTYNLVLRVSNVLDPWAEGHIPAQNASAPSYQELFALPGCAAVKVARLGAQ